MNKIQMVKNHDGIFNLDKKLILISPDFNLSNNFSFKKSLEKFNISKYIFIEDLNQNSNEIINELEIIAYSLKNTYNIIIFSDNKELLNKMILSKMGQDFYGLMTGFSFSIDMENDFHNKLGIFKNT